MFSESEEEDDQNVQLTINEHFAKAFQYRKEREELEQLKEKYGSDFNESDLEEESTDSESAESEDEDGEELTPAVDAAILRTLARIRNKDPAIYNSGKNIYGEEEEKVATNVHSLPSKKKQAKDRSKPVTLRQVAIDAVLNPSRSPSPEPAIPTHVEEQRALRDETIAAFHGAVPQDDDDDLLVLREKTKDEVLAEEEEYKTFLERQVGSNLKDLVILDRNSEDKIESGGTAKEDEGSQNGDLEGRKKQRKKKKTKTQGEKDHEFLMNYILNRGWVDKSATRLPTYNEITGSKTQGKGKAKAEDESEDEEDENDPGLLSDASFESLASHFESSYNHRFEEPGADAIQTFPRNITSVVRRADSTRKEARERRKSRKEEEMAKKKEEIRRLKGLKLKEMKRKLEKIGKESGLFKGKAMTTAERGDELEEVLNELDLEGEWDPEKHDRQMEGLFAEVGMEEEGDEEIEYDADGKPIWKDDIDIGDIHMSDDDAIEFKSKKDKKKEKKKKKKGKANDDDQGGVDVDAMDADKIGAADDVDDEEWDGTEEMRKRKWQEYMNELYELDFNDLVGDMPTRFKYVSIPSQTYSLDPVEILLATDQELNEYMSVKKYAPYRQDKGDRSKWDQRQKEKLRTLKANLQARQTGFVQNASGSHHEQRQEGEIQKKKRKGKKERMKLKGVSVDDEENDGISEPPEETANQASVQGSKSETGEKRKRDDAEASTTGVEEGQNLETPGDHKKKKRRRRHGKKETQEVS